MSSPTVAKKGNILTRCLTSCCWKNENGATMYQLNKSKWRQFGYKATEYSLPPIFAYLIELYDGKDVITGLESCRINPDYTSEQYLRNDLEYYIPQLTNFVVFHEEFLNNKLTGFLEEASKADPYFAHSYYWYINSLLSAIGQQKAQAILDSITGACSSEPQAQLFKVSYDNFYAALKQKWPREVYEAQMKEFENKKPQTQDIIKRYKSGDLDLSVTFTKIKAVGIDLKPYISPYLQGEANTIASPFTSTIVFLEDLYVLAEDLLKKKTTDKVAQLKSGLQNVNKALPSCVYVPFVKDSIRHYAILNIVIEETRVFSTKERAPFYLCVEIFRPQEELSHEFNEIFHTQEVRKRNKFLSIVKRALRFQPQDYMRSSRRELEEQFRISNLDEMVSSPLTLRKLNQPQHDISDLSDEIQRAPAKSMVIHSNRSLLEFTPPEEPARSLKKKYTGRLSIPNRLSQPRKLSVEEDDGISVAYQEESNSAMTTDLSNKVPPSERTTIAAKPSTKESIKIEMRLSTTLNEPLFKEEKEEKGEGKVEKKPVLMVQPVENGSNISMLSQQEIYDFFGEDSKDQMRRIKENSPFKHLKSWKLVHMIVKTGADMKEEQFAIQLISQFDQIFKDEGVKLILTPYEILSLGNDFGILEAVKDAITMSRLKEKMYRQNIPTLNIFFDRYYGEEADRARRRFCRSLAAYSLVCYFLQIKDRHNGNILFHKQGHILHIDFGFLFTNAPGKGLEFEKKVPFKLTNEYVEVLGGPRSSLFQEFRKLFYRGFMAARKHREQILILVKMMYSTQGSNLPCFRAGNRAIIELEQRFCPPGVQERDLNEYCYNLINQSLDNWRAKCYDKYQYHFQGIFY